MVGAYNFYVVWFHTKTSSFNDYFGPRPPHNKPQHEEKKFDPNIFGTEVPPKNVCPFGSANPEIAGVNVQDRENERVKNSLTLFTGGGGIFYSTKFVTSLLASVTGG